MAKPKEERVIRTGQSTSTVYSLEARLVYPSNPPIQIGSMTIDGTWRPVRTITARIGVPNNIHDAQAKYHGYLEHDAAMSLAYWLLAEADSVRIQVRLVEYEFVSTYTVSKVAEKQPIQTFDYYKDLKKKSKLNTDKYDVYH